MYFCVYNMCVHAFMRVSVSVCMSAHITGHEC